MKAPKPAAAVPRICLYLFGTFRVERDEQSIRLPTRKVQALLAYLVLYPAAHTREKLAALLWGDSPDGQARGSLRKALTLRTALAEGRVTSELRATMDDKALAITHHFEQIAIILIAALMVLKPF